MKYKIDAIRIRGNNILINGWVVGKDSESEADYSVFDASKDAIDFKLVPARRDDVSMMYFKQVTENELGFNIEFPYVKGKDYFLRISLEGKTTEIRFNEDLIAKRSTAAYRRRAKIKDLANVETVKVALNFLKDNGPKALYRKVRNKLQNIDSDFEYPEWYEKTAPSEEELRKQREHKWEKKVKFSIVIPAYETPDSYLKALLNSILLQTYPYFEVCIADGSRPGKDKEMLLRDYSSRDERIRYTILGENKGISENTNAAMEMATGDYIVLSDHDDILTENALYEVAAAIEKSEAEGYPVDCLYSDEDKLDMEGESLFEPHFKPDFNADLLTSVNYITHLFVFDKKLADSCGMFDASYDGAQDYDFIFRITEKSENIVHIPKVLYHWRSHIGSTAASPESKMYAFEAGAEAIKAHYKRAYPKLKIRKIEKGIDYGIYHTYFENEQPLISVVIPNMNHTADLDKAIRSLKAGNYQNLEFIIVENNSNLEETWEYYENIQKEFSDVRVVRYEEQGFNFSKLNNFGVKYAKGDYYLFMNNDVEMIDPDSLNEMMGYAQRDDVGIVGVRLLYEDDTIQHAGVVIGFGGVAGHTFIGFNKHQSSYHHRAMTTQDYSAVTAACMLTKKEVFDKVSGFSEELAVAFNDIDYCLKVRALEQLVVYNPYAVFHHYESKSRGLEDTEEKEERFNRETATFIKKWPDILNKGDPYYNPNLTLRKSDFSLRDLLKENIGEPYHIKGIEKYF